jgi:hypothetical protein
MKTSRERWFEQLHAARERRRAVELQIDGRAPREAFMATLADIAERMLTQGFVEPSAGHKVQWGGTSTRTSGRGSPFEKLSPVRTPRQRRRLSGLPDDPTVRGVASRLLTDPAMPVHHRQPRQ